MTPTPHLTEERASCPACIARAKRRVWSGWRVGLTLFAAAGLTPVSAAESAVPDRVPTAKMILIPVGTYQSILRSKDEPERVRVPAFFLDERPVTNAEFLAFVRANPRWQRSRVGPLFADQGYLSDWAGDLELGVKAPAESPVVRVSWFAARAFATWVGKRLPTTAEWERAAAVGFASERGSDEPEYRRAALAWFSERAPEVPPTVGNGRPNFHGVRDLLSLIWEWVDDFNTALVTGESRADTGLERTLFCGAGAATARDLDNYPAFIRAGMRSSLRASYAVPNLGFRCAKSTPPSGAGIDVALTDTGLSLP